MTTMRALQVTKIGDCRHDQDVLTLSDVVPKPVLDATSSDLLVKVLACAVNPGDLKFMTGAMPQSKQHVPYTPGLEVCGIVEAVGAKATGQFQEGDRVVAALRPFARGGGGLADYVVVESGLAAKIPTSIKAVDAASLPLAGVMALQAIKDVCLREGAKIAVLGASTSAGVLVVQLAKRAGASFIAGTTTDATLVAGLPLDLSIVDDNHQDKWWEVLKGKQLDVVIDCIGCTESRRQAEKTLAKGGVYATMLGEIISDGDVRATSELLGLGFTSIFKSLVPVGPKFKMIAAFPTTKTLEDVVVRVADGGLKPIVDTNTPFAFKVEAMQHAVTLLKSKQVRGKAVVVIREE